MYAKIIAIVIGLVASGWAAKYYYIDVPAAEAAAQAAQIEHDREQAKQEALKRFMNQGNGKIRKPGESGFKRFDITNF